MMCPLCFETAGFWLQARDRDYHHCDNCHLVFVPPSFFLPKEAEIQRYLQHENSLDNPGYVRMFEEKIALLRETCPPRASVLDFGCGHTPVLQTLLRRRGYHAEVYDPYFFPEPPEKQDFDLVVSTETFEHLKDPARELDRVLTWLAGSGLCAVMTRFYPQQDGKPDAKAFENWYYKNDPTHIRFYCPETFEWIATHKPFKIILNNQVDFIILRKTEATPPTFGPA